MLGNPTKNLNCFNFWTQDFLPGEGSHPTNIRRNPGIQDRHDWGLQDSRGIPGPPPSGVQVMSNSMQGFRSPDPVPWRSSCPVWKVTSLDKLLKPKRRFFGSGVVWNTAVGEHRKGVDDVSLMSRQKPWLSEIRQSLAIFFWGWWPDSPCRQMLREDIACTVRNI